MVQVNFDKLYDNYNVLSQAKENIAAHSNEYREAIEGTKGSIKEKRLAAQIISQFFKHFPSLQSDAIEAIFDICEDDDSSIRIAAMKTLPNFCKENKDFVPRIADILAQLLQLEDSQEYNVACNSLFDVLVSNPMIVVKSIFKQVNSGETLVRYKCIKFLVTKVKGLDKSVLTLEIEDYIVNEIKKALQDSTANEFVTLMTFLMSTRFAQTFTGQQELVEIVAEQIELGQEFTPIDDESNNVDRLITCVKFILPIFSAKVESTKFVAYYCDQVLSQWDKIALLESGDLLQMVILRQLAELSIHCGKLENASLSVVQVYQKLKDYMPPPPEDTDIITMPLLDFTVVECLLYTFHKLARQCPDFLTHDPNVLKDFRARLMYFSRGAQGCTKALDNLEIKDKTLSEEDIKKQKMAPILLNNINALIKDLFYQPPKYQCIIILSFKQRQSEAVAKSKPSEPETNTNVTRPTKRHVPITFDSNGSSSGPLKQTRHGKDGMKIYTPPSGKFSNTFQGGGYGGNRPLNRHRGGGRGGRGSANRTWRK